MTTIEYTAAEFAPSAAVEPMEDYEWDPSKSTATAWSTAASKTHRGRRAYGRHANGKKGAVGAAPGRSKKKRAMMQRQRLEHEREAALEEAEDHDGSLQRQSNSSIDFHAEESVSSLSSFDLARSESQGQLSQVLGARPPPLSLHRRTKSVVETARRSSSVTSAKAESIRSSSLSSIDVPAPSAHDGAENTHPNLHLQKNASILSPEIPPTKITKLNSTPLQMQSPRLSEKVPVASKKKNSQPKRIRQLALHPKSYRAAAEKLTDETPLSPTFSSHSSSSFSSLAKAGDLGPSWVNKSLNDCISKWDSQKIPKESEKTSNNCETEPNPMEGIGVGDITPAPTSPARSLTASICSSRKRGVCASPLLDADDACDLSSSDALSISRNSRASSSSFVRSRARSRIFSPGSTKKIMDAAAAAMKEDMLGRDSRGQTGIRRRRNRFNGKKEGRCESDTDSDGPLDNRVNLSYESNANAESDSDLSFGDTCDTKKGVAILPPAPLRQSSSAKFHESVFGSVEGKKTSVLQLVTNDMLNNSISSEHYDDIFASIPNYDDLKFMIKALRKVKAGNSFGMKSCCTIVPNKSWPSVRRTAFIHWAMNRLGFALRSGGGTVTFLQTTYERGCDILNTLERVIIRYKEKMLKKRTQNGKNNAPTPARGLTHAPHQGVHMMDLGHVSSEKKIPLSVPLFQVTVHHTRSGSKSLTACSNCNTVFSPQDKGLEEELIHDFGSLSVKAKNSSRTDHTQSIDTQKKDTPLVRAVTLEANNETQEEDLSLPLPCFSKRESSLSAKEANFEIRRRPRLSAEHTVGDRDLVRHLHGVSPNDRQESLHPSKLALPTRPGTTGRFSGDHISPHCTNAPCPVPTKDDAVEHLDFVETPMPDRSGQIWGSQPIPGKDWGISRRSNAEALAVLLERFEKAHSTSEFCVDSPRSKHNGFGCGSAFGDSPFAHPMCLVPANIAATAASSADLGFDFEVENAPRATPLVGDNNNSDEYETERGDECLAEKSIYQRGSVGTSKFAGLRLDETGISPEKVNQKRKSSLAKHHRISLCAAALHASRPPRFSTFSYGAAERDSLDARRGLSFGVGQSKALSPSSIANSPSRKETESSLLKHLTNHDVLSKVFSFLSEGELLRSASPVCSVWADAATDAHASLMLISVGCSTSFIDGDNACNIGDIDDDGTSTDGSIVCSSGTESIARSMERPWNFLTRTFPWANFLSEGAFKRVYRVFNSTVKAEEAVSVMDVDLIESTGNKHVVGAELAVSALLSSLVRRNICPNFVLTRGVFTCLHEPPSSHWGCAKNKKPKGSKYVPGQSLGRKPREPSAKNQGRYQYIRMELCRKGDIEEFIKEQPNLRIPPNEAQMLLFQMAFSLHAAGDKFGLKHYDVKLLNFFLQTANDGNLDKASHPYTALRYGVGSHVFSLRMDTSRALIAKLADYGTAVMRSESNGQPVTIAQFTTLENSPPEYLLLGDAATQGYGHDCFGLGLCMLHLFTGNAPYEEILEDVVCPPTLKQKLKRIWQDESSSGYDVIRSLILADVYTDENGDIEGEPDDVLYDTLYRYLVLFGIPKDLFGGKESGRVWRAIKTSLETKEEKPPSDRAKRNARSRNERRHVKRQGPDAAQFLRDQRAFSLAHGSDVHIANARQKLEMMDGAMELLLSLVVFDPTKRATPLDVINSTFMASLREEPGRSVVNESDIVHSYMAYATAT